MTMDGRTTAVKSTAVESTAVTVIPIRAGRSPRLNRCVISLGVGKKVYKDCIKRLQESLIRTGFDGDFLFWNERFPDGAPSQFEAPFAFKTYCFFVARDLGYEEILWMDPVCVALRPLEPVFALIQANGYVMFNNNYGQVMGQWCSDEALAANGLSRDEAMLIPETPCSVLGLDLRSPLANHFLEGWYQIMSDGVTARGTRQPVDNWEDYMAIFWNKGGRISADPRVGGHRCDQPAAGIVAHRLGMTPYADLLRDIHFKGTKINRQTAILHHREFGEEITSLDDIYYHVFVRMPWIQPVRDGIQKVGRKVKRLAGRLS
jgi:hypothetical protein